MSYLIKDRMMRDKSNQGDSVKFGDSAVAAVDQNVSAKKERGTVAPLFEAKKEKVEVTGYNYLPSVVENENSSLNIDRLPNEMLQKIFEHLIEIENVKDSYPFKLVRNFTFLNCRLVNSRWKSVMDRALEKDTIAIWKTKSTPISLIDAEAELPALGCIFVLKPKGGGIPCEWAYLPPPLESIEEKVNPFPLRSLELTSNSGDSRRLPGSRKPRRGTQLIRLISFFSKFGDHLTSLFLWSLTLSPETFIGILGNTPNLKALNLMKVLFLGDLANCAQLPALQKLQHVRIVNVTFVQKKEELSWIDYVNDRGHIQNQLYDWILSPYKEQLLTLDIYGRYGFVTAINFANLARLLIHHDNISFHQPNVLLYPQLKSLFLIKINVQISFNGDMLKWFQQHIEPLATTLSELDLDLSRRWIEDGPLFQLSTKLTHSQKKTDEVVFREMKTLYITIPLFPEEVEVIKTLIKRFPNLETLMFLDRNWRIQDGDVKNVVDRDEYIKVCPKLKKVIIRIL